MPTYEYQCKACGHRFERFQKISDEPVKLCPRCKGSVQRIISGGTGIIFKGSGFYATDYAKPQAKSDSVPGPPERGRGMGRGRGRRWRS